MFARFFIDRPIFAWVISIVITLLGVVAAFSLPVDQYPEITPPTVTVTAIYPGASAQVVADTVAAPIEQQVNGVEQMLYMSSQSTNDGNYVLTVTFEVGANLNMAQVLVQNRVALALPQLPPQVQIQGVSTKKRSPNILLAINLISPDQRYDNLYLSNYATIQLRDELLRIKGVGDIAYLGQRDYSMRIWLNPEEMSSRNLTAPDVVAAVQSQNVQVAAGQIGQEPVPGGQQMQLPMTALGRLDSVEQFRDIILKTGDPAGPEGAVESQVVHLRDVARVELGSQNADQICRLDGQPSIGLAIFQLPGSNALNVADAIKARMEELKKSFPKGLDYNIVYDTTPFIEQSVHEVFKTLGEAVLLVAIVVLLFLQDWKAMILPMIDVPVSLIGTFTIMLLFGFTLNNLTLFGLVLAIGIVVDDAIVVLENIERLIATGLDARTATIKAMDEVTGPIIAITLVLCSVFIPSIFFSGITGQFYRQFALTIAVSMVISAVNAMTLTPARAVTIFKTEETAGGHAHRREALPWWIFGVLGGVLTVWLGHRLLDAPLGLNRAGEPGLNATVIRYAIAVAYFLPGAVVGGVLGWFITRPVNTVLGWIFTGFNRVFDRIIAVYGWTVGRSLRISLVVMLIYGGLLFLTYRSLARAPTGFLPTQDQGYLLVNLQLPDSTSLQITEKVMQRVQQLAKDTPGVVHTTSIAGQSFLTSSNGSNLGSMFVILDHYEHRRSPDLYDAAIAARLQRRCAEEIDDAVVAVFRPPSIRGLGNAGGFKLQVEQRGLVDLNELQNTTDELVRRANADPHFAGVFTLFRANTPQLYIDIDRTKCESLKVPIKDVFTTLQVYMGGLYINNFNRFGRTWQVQAQADAPFRASEATLKRLEVRNAEGAMVPLGTLATVKDSAGPLLAMRYNMYASAAINGSPAPGVSSGEVIRTMTDLAAKVQTPFEWTEITYLQTQAGNPAIIFALGTLLVYLVLAAKYESWRLPLAVILVVPICLLAAVTGMAIVRLPIDIFVQIGFLVLVGLASKNAILIVEFANQLRGEGRSVSEAIIESSKLRFRPIVMTSFAFIFGVLPLVLAEGAGAEMRRSLGTAVMSGMIGVTIFGVLLTPVFYYIVERYFGKKT